jgi:hypothetical protein
MTVESQELRGIASDDVWTLVLMVRVEMTAVPFGVTVAGLKVHEELAGSPEQLNCSCWLNPPVGAMVRTTLPVLPCPTVRADGLIAIEKSGAIGAMTVTFVLEDVALAKFASPPYEAVMLSAPTGREVTFRVATPLESVAVPRLVLPL